jgi:hypothetical protein
MSTSRAETTADPRWRPLYRIGGAAALFSVAIIPIQLIIFIVWGQPETALGWFNLFQDNKLAGLLAFELLFVVNAALGIATALALYVALRRANESLMAIATVLALVEALAFIVARPALEMLYLSNFPRRYQPLQHLLPDSPDRDAAEQHLRQSNRLHRNCGGHS